MIRGGWEQPPSVTKKMSICRRLDKPPSKHCILFWRWHSSLSRAKKEKKKRQIPNPLSLLRISVFILLSTLKSQIPFLSCCIDNSQQTAVDPNQRPISSSFSTLLRWQLTAECRGPEPATSIIGPTSLIDYLWSCLYISFHLSMHASLSLCALWIWL